MEVPIDKIERDDWVQTEEGQWHRVDAVNDVQIFSICGETLLAQRDIIALLAGVSYPGLFPYECVTCSERMDLIAVLED